MISQTAPINNKIHLSFTIPKADLRECMEIIEPFLSKDHQLVIDQNITKFSIVGMGMKTTSGVASRLLNVFCENRIGVKISSMRLLLWQKNSIYNNMIRR